MSTFSFQKTELFLPLRLGPTARETLQEFIDIDVTAGDLERILNANQAYRDLFFRFVSQKTAKVPKQVVKAKDGEASIKPDEPDEPASPTHRLINLLGMLGSRNLILALRIHRLTEGRFPVSLEGNVDIKASDYLKRALEAEDLFVRNKLEYSETAYAAGVYFDLCERLYSKDNGLKKLEAYYKRVWQRATRTGLVAYFLAEKIPGYTPRTALTAGMLAHAGKLHLSVHFEDDNYAEFEEELEKNSAIPPLARVILERQKFGLVQEDVGSHTLRYFDVFRGLVPMVANFREPYNLKGADKAAHGLCVLLNLADNMARTWKLPADEKDAVFNDWSYPGLSILKVKRSTLIEVMKRAMSLR
ncbi:MAG: HDOD domain-containing protein [Bdellovibrionota bacterium]